MKLKTSDGQHKLGEMMVWWFMGLHELLFMNHH